MRFVAYVLLLVLMVVIIKAIDLLYAITDYIYRGLSAALGMTIVPYDVSFWATTALYVGVAAIVAAIIIKFWVAIRGEKT